VGLKAYATDPGEAERLWTLSAELVGGNARAMPSPRHGCLALSSDTPISKTLTRLGLTPTRFKYKADEHDYLVGWRAIARAYEQWAAWALGFKGGVVPRPIFEAYTRSAVPSAHSIVWACAVTMFERIAVYLATGLAPVAEHT
jgi:hypothetical protein